MIMMQPGTPLPDETLSVLGDMGYQTIAPYDYGDMQVIYRDGDDVQAASDPRNRGVARVVE